MQKKNINFEDFLKLDIRVCEILEAERVEKSDKLIKMLINTGFDKRISITNIGSVFDPSVLLGKKIPFVLNLEPRKIMGIETKAMMFITEDVNGILLLEHDVKVGSKFV